MNNMTLLNEISVRPNVIPSFIPVVYDAIARLNIKIEEAKKVQNGIASVPLWEKYSLSIEEAAVLFGIGEKRIRQICMEHPRGDFYMEIGNHVKIKRAKFAEFLDGSHSV